MFCPKCGAQASNGAQFCQKCGAKLSSDTPTQPTVETTDSAQQSGNTPTDVPKKKKSKKPLIIAAIIVAFIAILIAANADNMAKRGEQAKKDEEYINAHQQSSENNSGGDLADTTEQVLICGISAQDLMNMSAEDIIATFGEPDVYEADVYYDTDRIEYESDQVCFIMSEYGSVFCLDAPAEKFTLNGQSFKQTLESLTSMIGNDYESLGAAGYRWNIDGLSYTFYIPDDEDIADTIEVTKIDTDDPVDNDAFLGDDGNYGSYVNLDSALVGRWRSYDGSALALNDSGGVDTVFQFWNTMNGNPEYVTWEASNGRLTLYGHYTVGCYWIIGEMDNMGATMEMLYMKEITANNEPYNSVPDLGTYQYDYYYFREKIGTGLIGAWTSRTGLDLIFYADGTGMVGNNYLTWWSDDETMLYYYPVQAKSYDYTVSGDTLTVFFSDGSKIYTRVGD